MDPRSSRSFGASRHVHVTIVAVLLLLGSSLSSIAGPGTGLESNGASLYPPVSYDGRYVAFYSLATNLVPDDTNEVGDIFLHDTLSGETSRVSLSSDGKEGDLESIWPSLSGDSRFVAFTSSATNLVENDTNNVPDVFVRDLKWGTTTRVSVSTDGAQSDGISYNYFPAISEDGSRVVFASMASNLVRGDTNRTWDIFVHDLTDQTTTLVSRSSNNRQGDAPSLHPVISGDGRHVAFNSYASNLVEGDNNRASDVFAHDLETATTTAVSTDASGRLGNDGSDRATISYDGSCIGYSSFASNLSPEDNDLEEDVFIHERASARNIEASQPVRSTQRAANQSSDVPWCCYISPACCIVVVITDRKSVIAADGNSIACRSESPDLVEEDSNFRQDIFLYDRTTDEIELISTGMNGEGANGDSVHHGLSADGRYVAFSSEASNLVPDDTNGVSDIFIYDRETGVTTRISVPSRD